MSIKLNGKAIKTKVKSTRNPLFMDEKYTGPEPVWDTERARSMSDEEFDHFMRKSLNYYNYFYTQKDLKKYVVEWMKNSSEFNKEEVKAFERSSDKAMPMTVHGLIMAHRQGMPFRERHIEFIDKCIEEAIRGAGKEEIVVEAVEAKAKVYTPTIQDRLNEKTSEHIGEFEGELDNVYLKIDSKFKAYEYLTANNVPQSQLGKFEAVFQSHKDELELAQSKKDEQLTEGYRHLKTADFKRILGWLSQVLADIDQYRGVKKATKKVRVKRPVSKEKLVAKLKYAKEFKEFKLISINPADIVGASELWIYNIKTRKLGRYLASQYNTLGVKGTGITGFDEFKSVAKTLRKPEDKLKEFNKAGKVQLRKFLDDIRATETKLNGRINSDTLLLRVQ